MYEKLFVKTVWPILNRRRRIISDDFMQILEETQFDNSAAREFRRLNALQSLCEYAYEKTLFYRERFDSIGLKPQDIQSFDDFARIPVLTRQDLNDNLKDLITTSLSAKEIHYDKTGGTSGITTRFARDNKCLVKKKAIEYFFNQFTGWKVGKKIAFYWPAIQDFSGHKETMLRFFKRTYIDRSLSLYAGKLNEGLLSVHVRQLQRFKPDIVRAFPNSLQILAEYCKKKDIVIPVACGIISVGETLQEFQRVLFTRLWPFFRLKN
jgi:phenylacetate-CoA ligase